MSNASTAKKPTHTAYVVRDFKDGEGKAKGAWHEIGAAWSHKDGKGFDLSLDALPVTGRVVLRINEAKPKAEK